ncbi:hypothetical protein SPRG_05787 [Saprolegnia parasitica CBS 223.65]|uniref:MARVEL domain-containing protein n=1 Tax=Saprolegnia parasitica (strain CBS 223.65) TaxID=695850 RepID=A0A067CQV4_SAPPC|nr:hypothetical protein SPRG_05787 [Saprolegnia parasitica CBS 223.65]KDO28916.1 hypothetical protein SPRG_05787 [Saprolegnia parasitica CBS 223.65]|eukprot:XP_012200459.1 hypothetical protein SPRG_05787 [Saprolegnia parasitica CBS 223.65]
MNSFFAGANQLQLLTRGAQCAISAIAFFCVTGVTGLHAGDFAFVTTFTLAAHAALYYLLAIHFKKLELSAFTVLVTDGVLGALALVAAIVLAASSSAFFYCHANSCGALYIATIGLFLGALLQGFLTYLSYAALYLTPTNAVEDLENPVHETTEYVAPVEIKTPTAQ